MSEHGTANLFSDRPVLTAVRRRRDLAVFDSKQTAYRWAETHWPKQPAGAVTVCPPTPHKDGEVWTLTYPVTFPGVVRYFELGRSGHLLRK